MLPNKKESNNYDFILFDIDTLLSYPQHLEKRALFKLFLKWNQTHNYLMQFKEYLNLSCYIKRISQV